MAASRERDRPKIREVPEINEVPAASQGNPSSPARSETPIEAELRRQYEKARLFAEVTLKIRQSLQLKEILSTTVSEVQHLLRADRVLIYQVFADGTGKTISEAVLPEFEAVLGCEFPEEVFPSDYRSLYANGRVQAIADVHAPDSGVADCLVEFVDQFSVKAKLIVPIVPHPTAVPHPAPNLSEDTPSNQLWGLLIAHHCAQPHGWSEFELELMQQLADQISLAIAQGGLLENLEDLVAARTTQLSQINQELQQEICDRQQAEIALRRSEEQLRLITNALPVLIAYVDGQQRYQFNNHSYESWLGKSPQELQGKTLQQVWGDFYYSHMQPWVNQVLAGEAVTYENEIPLPNGQTRSVSVTYIPHQEGDDAKIKGFFALTSDISDRKAIERMKDEFISVVSHELRTPLTSIHSALRILATGRLGKLSQDGQQMLEIADDNTERLVRLVNNVLDLQRIEAGAVTMELEACSAAGLMVKATEAMQAMAQQHHVELVTHPLEIRLWADADYLVQALTNLLSNAIKFSPPQRRVELTAQVLPAQILSTQPRLEALVQFQVQDQGPGIPPEHLESIFERFHQVDSSDARKRGGTGLGLTICRKIIEQHGGHIWAESTLGEGSRLLFTLPIFADLLPVELLPVELLPVELLPVDPSPVDPS
jgi:two-component system, OmpR family, sensor histidine kinase VicK